METEAWESAWINFYCEGPPRAFATLEEADQAIAGRVARVRVVHHNRFDKPGAATDTERLDWMDRGLRQVGNYVTLQEGKDRGARKKVDSWAMAADPGTPIRHSIDLMMKDAAAGRVQRGA